ncbi:MAG: hypothetical protein LBL46_04240 [Rickettsiales bacterium]|nr:hypothetical protein [Rickettsiales bacterium]
MKKRIRELENKRMDFEIKGKRVRTAAFSYSLILLFSLCGAAGAAKLCAIKLDSWTSIPTGQDGYGDDKNMYLGVGCANGTCSGYKTPVRYDCYDILITTNWTTGPDCQCYPQRGFGSYCPNGNLMIGTRFASYAACNDEATGCKKFCMDALMKKPILGASFAASCL